MMTGEKNDKQYGSPLFRSHTYIDILERDFSAIGREMNNDDLESAIV